MTSDDLKDVVSDAEAIGRTLEKYITDKGIRVNRSAKRMISGIKWEYRMKELEAIHQELIDNPKKDAIFPPSIGEYDSDEDVNWL